MIILTVNIFAFLVNIYNFKFLINGGLFNNILFCQLVNVDVIYRVSKKLLESRSTQSFLDLNDIILQGEMQFFQYLPQFCHFQFPQK